MLIGLLCLLLLASGLVYIQWKLFLNTPLSSSGKSFVFQVKPGQTFRQVALTLKKQNRLSSPRFFTWLAHSKHAPHWIQSGDYLVTSKLTPGQLIEKMISGEVMLQRFTIVDGWTFERVLQKIKENPFFSHTLKNVSTEQMMGLLGATGTSPEGQFFPDTYFFRQGAEDVDILKKAYKKMQRILEEAWQLRDQTVPYKTPQEALVVASLIQKETHLPEEYTKVSSVIRNRLKHNMPLQMDPTVIYGLKSRYTYPLTQKQMAIDTPYNTYTRRGLPPTPIAMVNKKALYAALHPEPSKVLYFVANGSGGHTFSHRFDDHRVAVNAYRKAKKVEKMFQEWGEICLWILGFAVYDQK